MKLFAQIRKVDEEKRLVFGRIAEEAVDNASEVMDYMASKPHFEKWSADIAKATSGASLGNVRAMHSKVAAGKLVEMDFNDGAKTIDVCSKVVDDNEWRKVLEGVYTGFSIGGKYLDRKVEKMAGQDVTRYTAVPSEVSLVDRPCMPGARFFEVQKADGSLAKVDFQHQPETDAEPELVVAGSADEVAQLAKVMNDNKLSMGDVLKAVDASVLTKSAAPAEGEGAAGDKPADGEKPAEGEGGKKPAEEKKPPQGEDDNAEKVDAEQALTKLEAALADAAAVLAKVGARNSAVDATRISKIHDMAVELGAACAPATAAKVEPAGDLAKADALQKLVADAVAPLQKALDAAAEKITKLEAQPAPARVTLRAVSKSADLITDDMAKVEAPAPVVDSHGEEHEAAGLIKSLHRVGGRPMAMPGALAKS